jgi:hypothetical protein
MRSLSRHASKFFLVQKFFLLKYQPSVDKWKVIGGVGLQTCPHSGFLDLSMKTSHKGWHKSWFYCENHEPSLPPFVGRLHEFRGTWSEEPTPAELPIVAALGNRVNNLKNPGLTGVCVAPIGWPIGWCIWRSKYTPSGTTAKFTIQPEKYSSLPVPAKYGTSTRDVPKHQ